MIVRTTILSLILLFSLAAPSLSALDPAWIRVLSGSVATTPVVGYNRVIATCDDTSVTALTPSGDFLWSRVVRGGARYLWMSSRSLLIALSSNGTIHAFSQDGYPVWRIKGPSRPVLQPLEGLDGRIFIFFANRLVTLTHTGVRLWQIPLGKEPIHVSLTGNGEVLISFMDNTLMLISPFGEILAEYAPDDKIGALAEAPSGFFILGKEDSLSYYDVRRTTGIQRIWQTRLSAQPLGVTVESGTAVIILSDGTIVALNESDGERLWATSLGSPVLSPLTIEKTYGQFSLVCPGLAAAVSPDGSLLWVHSLSGSVGLPVMDSSGTVYAASGEWKLGAWSPEKRISTQKKPKKGRNYSILTGRSVEYGIPFMSGRRELELFFKELSQVLDSGSIGPAEVGYARRLTEILGNDVAALPYTRSLDGWERSRAAVLLGKMGSLEYREVILSSAYGNFDEAMAIGILQGLCFFGPDEDGQTLQAIRHLVRAGGIWSDPVKKSACDVLYTIARYSYSPASLEAVSEITALAGSPNSTFIREYAGAKLKALLETK